MRISIGALCGALLIGLGLASAASAQEGTPAGNKSGSKNAKGVTANTGVISGRVKNRWVKRFPAVVYLAKIKGRTFSPPVRPVLVDQTEKVFKPRVLPIVVGTRVKFLNSDPFEHNVLSPKPKFDLGKWGQGKHKTRVFNKPGAVTLLCNLHPEMIGYVVVCETPYFATTDSKGRFKIKGVPAGTYKLVTWHERLKRASVSVVVRAGETTKVSVKPKKR